MVLLGHESYYTTSPSEISQDDDKFSARPMARSSCRSGKFDARSNQQDTTSSDGESVGPCDCRESIEAEVVDLVCSAVQEMELLARNCLLVEESYQRYFIRNCGTQKEEAMWRQQGSREEALVRQATKAINQFQIGELWARMGYYNNEVAQRSNLFRMLLLEKKNLNNGGCADTKENSGTARQSEKRRRRPNGFCLDGAVALEIKGTMVSLKPGTLKQEESISITPSSSSSSSCHVALVHNPYSFHGPSQVTVNNAVPETEENPPSCAVSVTPCTPAPVASTPAGGEMSAVLKRIAPDHRLPSPNVFNVLLQFPPPAPRPSSCAMPSSIAKNQQVHVMLQPFLRKGMDNQTSGSGKPPCSLESSPFADQPTLEAHKPAIPPAAEPLPEPCTPVEEQPGLEPPQEDAPASGVVATSFAIKHLVVPESLAQLMEEVAEQLAEKHTDGRPTRRRVNKCPPDPGEDHGIVASSPTCSHIKFWKRLRANRGFAYFVCYQCGAKWRMSSKGMRPAAAAMAAQPQVQPRPAAEDSPPT
eukprot:GGOE01011922.1.p1 GENE.GGOE01011922.1~~GGOE01011922.1.p1  ORF type:complete len:531 (-),score=61.46 GGOE01011922.1:1274-2866(-)